MVSLKEEKKNRDKERRIDMWKVRDDVDLKELEKYRIRIIRI